MCFFLERGGKEGPVGLILKTIFHFFVLKCLNLRAVEHLREILNVFMLISFG